jgi:hypothetical protein
MRDLDQANALGIDTSDMVAVTHPDKKDRFGRGPAVFQMTRLAYVKRGLEGLGYTIVGEASNAAKPSGRERALLDEVEQLRQQLAEKNASNQSGGSIDDEPPSEHDRDALRAKLDALGVKYHHKSGVAKLQEQYDEALAAMNAADFGDEDE